MIIPGSSAASARQVLEALQRQIYAVAANSDVKGVVVTGSGDGFCRTAAEAALSHKQASELASLGQQVMFSLEKIGRPCLAAVESECSGLGLELALACDFIVASATASFGLPGIAAGQIPFCGGTQRLARLVGKSRAKEMIYSGEMITAGEALRIKLINRLYADCDLMTEAVRLMTLICSRSPNAIRIGGEVINAGYDIDLQTACQLERNAFALCFASFDQREGMQAFLDKRQPAFKGQ